MTKVVLLMQLPEVWASEGDRRINGRFHFWPMVADNAETGEREVRWLCNSEWIEEFHSDAEGFWWRVICWKPEVW